MTELHSLVTNSANAGHLFSLISLTSVLISPPWPSCLIDLLFLVNAVFARSAVDQQQESTNDREDLEEIVLGKIFVGVVLVKLGEN